MPADGAEIVDLTERIERKLEATSQNLSLAIHGAVYLNRRIVKLELALAQCYLHRRDPEKIRKIITEFHV